VQAWGILIGPGEALPLQVCQAEKFPAVLAASCRFGAKVTVS
jgi:hypothetical protein